MNVTAASPAEIDTEIARIEGSVNLVLAQIDRTQNTIARAEKDAYTALLHPIEDAKFRLEILSQTLTELVDEKEPYAEEYSRRGGWSRYYLVINTGGHLHTTKSCSTCYDTTEFAWMTELSGSSHGDVVTLAGSQACLSCFPEYREYIESARPGTLEAPEQREAREQREAEKAERARKAAEKGVTTPEGRPLYEVHDAGFGGWQETTYVVKTATAAWRNALQAANDLLFYNARKAEGQAEHAYSGAWRETIRRNLAALAHKRGVDESELYYELILKAQAKYRKELHRRLHLSTVAQYLIR